MKLHFTISILLFLLMTNQVNAQCPEGVDVSEIIINTQEEYDKYVVNYPNCGWHIIKVNNKFIGDPRPVEYLFVLIVILSLILVILKFIFLRVKAKDTTLNKVKTEHRDTETQS